MDINQEVERLRQIPMFAKVDISKLKLLAFTSQLLTCKPGEVLIKVNDPSDCVYLVMDGELEIVSLTTCGREQSIVRQRGDVIGEIAVIAKSRRTATVRALTEARVLRIEADAFIDMMTRNSDVALDVMRQLCDKLAQAMQINESLQARLSELKQEKCSE
ncbi:cyclic nucleotide-binding domain-containing protein [Marinobacterium lutimaris]|uniref:Cyclic nucleotide-binding domain-containing protein n=1 Tax=Marinobacterium lutimaris TaxID=568106 RepID=A0A1H6D7D1_9GAMM|nr:cyclic nucleotide-binding domain-containing protein [Marinobacterium lutimaris]SEG81171.1 Cyclic nucleotide-binding domain-containing protein [Marinobacterium lutimaris]